MGIHCSIYAEQFISYETFFGVCAFQQITCHKMLLNICTNNDNCTICAPGNGHTSDSSIHTMPTPRYIYGMCDVRCTWHNVVLRNGAIRFNYGTRAYATEKQKASINVAKYSTIDVWLLLFINSSQQNAKKKQSPLILGEHTSSWCVPYLSTMMCLFVYACTVHELWVPEVMVNQPPPPRAPPQSHPRTRTPMKCIEHNETQWPRAKVHHNFYPVGCTAMQKQWNFSKGWAKEHGSAHNPISLHIHYVHRIADRTYTHTHTPLPPTSLPLFDALHWLCSQSNFIN